MISSTVEANGSIGDIERLVLGTAQLGMAYGIANQVGQPDQNTANDILKFAWDSGIRTIDTAQAYGESESVIGQFLVDHPECKFNIITKLSPEIDITSPDNVQIAIKQSLKRLRVIPQGILLHGASQMDAWDGCLGDALREMKRKGEISHLGISVYHPKEFRRALQNADFTSIQAPFNIFDRRLEEQNLIDDADRKGWRVFIRSTFLQGLLLMDGNNLPSHMNFAATPLRMWAEHCCKFMLNPAEAALQFVRRKFPQANVLIGCETKGQLIENIRCWLSPPFENGVFEEMELGFGADDILIDPSRWPTPTHEGQG